MRGGCSGGCTGGCKGGCSEGTRRMHGGCIEDAQRMPEDAQRTHRRRKGRKGRMGYKGALVAEVVARGYRMLTVGFLRFHWPAAILLLPVEAGPAPSRTSHASPHPKSWFPIDCLPQLATVVLEIVPDRLFIGLVDEAEAVPEPAATVDVRMCPEVLGAALEPPRARRGCVGEICVAGATKGLLPGTKTKESCPLEALIVWPVQWHLDAARNGLAVLWFCCSSTRRWGDVDKSSTPGVLPARVPDVHTRNGIHPLRSATEQSTSSAPQRLDKRTCPWESQVTPLCSLSCTFVWDLQDPARCCKCDNSLDNTGQIDPRLIHIVSGLIDFRDVLEMSVIADHAPWLGRA
eukprot:gene9569-biopygen4715